MVIDARSYERQRGQERAGGAYARTYVRTYVKRTFVRMYVLFRLRTYARNGLRCGLCFTYVRTRTCVRTVSPATYVRTYVRIVSPATVRYVLFHLPRTYARTYVLFPLPRTLAWRCQDALHDAARALPRCSSRTLAWRCQDAPTTAARAELSDALYGPALGNRRSAAAAASDQGEKAWPSWGAVSAAAGAVQANANSEGRDVHDQRQRTACWLGVAKMLFTMKC